MVDGDRALVNLRDDKAGISYPAMWAVTGGGREPGESFRETAIRELEEETGYRSTNPVHYMSEFYYTPDGRLIRAQRFLDFYDGRQEVECREGQELAWKTIAELEECAMPENHRYAAQRAIKLATRLEEERDN